MVFTYHFVYFFNSNNVGMAVYIKPLINPLIDFQLSN